MKKILFMLLVSLFIPTACYGAMSAAITWEFNASASANMVGGGGFVTGASGTDFSRYTTAAAIEAAYPALGKFSGTDLACADGDVNPSVITSATHNFVAADVGNVIHVTAGAGYTAGWYQIVSCAGNAATLDRAVGTDGAKTNGTWYLGGALSLNSTLDDEFFDQLVAGQKVYFLKGNYTLGEAVAAAANGTNTLPIFMTGYTGTRDTACNGLDRPKIAQGTNTFTTGTYWRVRNFSITGTASTYNFKIGSYGILHNCKSINSSSNTSKAAFLGDTYATIFNNEAISYSGYGINTLGDTGVFGNYCHHSSSGIYSSGGGRILHNILVNNVLNELLLSGGSNSIIGNTIYGSESKIGTGINLSAQYNSFILNNIIYGFVTGISATAADTQTYIDYNDLYNNTTPVTNVTELSNDVATDPKFVNAAGTLIHDCETAWSEYTGTGVTATADATTYKVGTKSARATCTAATGVERVMTVALASTDMTTYNGLGLWVYSSVALAAGDWQILLDDTAACASATLTYNLPAMAATTWYWIYLDGGDMSGATAIISMGLYQAVDKGAMSFYVDDVRAANNDFTVQTGSGAIGTGFPQAMPGATGDYQMNIGVDQSDHSAGGTSNDVFGLID